MNNSSDTLAKIAKYKDFLAKNNCPQNLPDYDQEAYWDARYEIQQQQVYQWYVDWKTMKTLFKEFVSPSMKILQLGTGKSEVLDQMYKDGYKNLIGSDFSWTLINQKRSEERYLKRGITWERIDITRQWIDFGVNCIFQKATLDCLSPTDLKKTVGYIHSILKKNGIFFHISNTKPESRINVLKNWDVKVYELPKTVIPMFSEIDDSKSYYAYVCLK